MRCVVIGNKLQQCGIGHMIKDRLRIGSNQMLITQIDWYDLGIKTKNYNIYKAHSY